MLERIVELLSQGILVSKENESNFLRDVGFLATHPSKHSHLSLVTLLPIFTT